MLIRKNITIQFLLVICFTACQSGTEPQEQYKQSKRDMMPPTVKQKTQTFTNHGYERVDNYYWLRDDARTNKEIQHYLDEENAYTKVVLKDTEALQKSLYSEMRGRIKEDDSSVPYQLDGYWYYTRFEKGQEYPIYARRKGSMEAKEEVVLDVNTLAKGHNYFQVGNQEVSPNHRLLAYAEDNVGRRQYTIKIKNLNDGQLFRETIPNTSGEIAWSRDNQYIFYVNKDPRTLLPYQVLRHKLGTPSKDDVLIYEEKDNTFYTSVFNTRSRDYIVIYLNQTLMSEVRILDANDPTGDFKTFLPREKDHEYDVDHLGDTFYIRTNWEAKNFRLMQTTLNKSSNKSNWKEVIPHRELVLLRDFELFNDFLVMNERIDGLLKVRVKSFSTDDDYYIEPENDAAYISDIYYNPSPNTNRLRYEYSSMTTPDTVYEFTMDKKVKTVLKQDEILGGFDSNKYESERVWATARDGVKVPVSLVFKKGFKKDGSHPVYQYAYGSYGSSTDPYFRSTVISLLDRGFVFAIAHIRGGQELGRVWYEDGKLLKKKNTFTDFIDVTKFLVQEKYASKDKVFAAGGSAGGLLMGAVVNMEGMLYKGVIADVPFVDVINTMLDDSIPLTTGEYDEWGNPSDKVYYDYMYSYSPYDQVSKQAYPNLLVTSGYHDSQVQYWEPTKWVAKLRANKTDDNLLLLYTNMEAGHSGASGRFKSLEEVALRYAFVFKLLGITG